MTSPRTSLQRRHLLGPVAAGTIGGTIGGTPATRAAAEAGLP